MDTWQWKKIIEKMYDEEDYRLLEDQLNNRIQQQIEEAQRNSMQSGFKKASGFSYQGSNRNSNKPLTRNE